MFSSFDDRSMSTEQIAHDLAIACVKSKLESLLKASNNQVGDTRLSQDALESYETFYSYFLNSIDNLQR